MDKLTPELADYLAGQHLLWKANQAQGAWKAADEHRKRLIEAGCTGVNLDRWHPVFESPAHRAQRLTNPTGSRYGR